MKKVWVILTVMISVFAFVAVAMAADYNRSTGEYDKCDKCPLGRIPCPGQTIIQGPQGATSTADDPSYPFDFDGDAYVRAADRDVTPGPNYNPPAANVQTRGFGTWGYATGDNYADDPERNCKFLFDLCACDEACNIKTGKKMGIEMYIKTAGVYFADPVLIDAANSYGNVDAVGRPTVHFDIWPDYVQPCTINGQAQPNIIEMNTAPYYMANGEKFVGTPDDAAAGWVVRNFGPVEYYTGFSEGDNSKGMFESNLTHQYTNESPLPGEYKGAVPARNRVVALTSFEETDYLINEFDVKGECKLWIDIPAMRIDPTVAQEGATIKLQVRLLFNREIDGLCPACDPPDVCDVTFDVGIVCADSVVPQDDEYCMFFPYVLQGLAETDGWSTGIAISARGDAMPDDAWVKLTLKDRAGNLATYTRSSMGSGLVWSFVLDSQMVSS